VCQLPAQKVKSQGSGLGHGSLGSWTATQYVTDFRVTKVHSNDPYK